MPPKEESEDDIIKSIKQRIQGLPVGEMIPLLALLPRNWSFTKFKKTFGVSRRTIELVKEFQDTGKLRSRKVRSDRWSDLDRAAMKNFFFSPGIARAMPGKNLGNEDLFGIN